MARVVLLKGDKCLSLSLYVFHISFNLLAGPITCRILIMETTNSAIIKNGFYNIAQLSEYTVVNVSKPTFLVNLRIFNNYVTVALVAILYGNPYG